MRPVTETDVRARRVLLSRKPNARHPPGRQTRATMWRTRRRVLLLHVVLAVAACAAYANALRRPFLFDDMSAVVDNERIRRLADVRVLLPERERPVAGRPLVNLSFAVNYAFGGLDVVGYHLGNLALHVICGWLVFAIVRETLVLPRIPNGFGTHATAVGFSVAMIWMLHPLNSEVVTYVTQRTESMMACCLLLTLYASLRAR